MTAVATPKCTVARVGPGAVASVVAEALRCGLAGQIEVLDHAYGPVTLTPGKPPGPGNAKLYVDANSSQLQPPDRPAVRVYASRLSTHRRSEATGDGNFRYEARYTASVLVSIGAGPNVEGLVEARDRLVLAARWALIGAPLVGDRHRLDPDSVREAYWPPGPGENGLIICDGRVDVDVLAIEGPSLPPAGFASTMEIVFMPMTEA